MSDSTAPEPDPIARANHEDSKYFEKHPIQDDAGYGIEADEPDDEGENHDGRQ